MLGSHRLWSGLRGLSHPQRVALVGVALFAVVACSSSGASTSAGGNMERPAPPEGAAPAATAGPARAPETVAGRTSLSTDGSVVTADALAGPLIVRTGSLALEVKDLDAALLQARARVAGLGGYVSDSERANSDDQSIALVTYRIPAGRWDDALDALHGLATKVLGEQTRSVEVTGQVLDLAARIANLRATERALQAIMTQATRISDILDVQNQLTNVQGQIEQLSTEQAHLSDQAALGSLAVTYTVPVIAVARVSSGWNLSAEFDRALAQLVGLGQGIAVAAVWFGVVGLPIVGGLVFAALLAVFVARRLGLRRVPATLPSGPPPANA